MNRCARGAVILLASATLCGGCLRGGAASGDVGPHGPQGASAKMASTADLKDKRIGVVLGTVHDTLATKLYPKATVLQYDSPTDLTLAVMSGKVDAALSDAEPLAERLRTNGALAVLGEPLVSFPIAAGFRKDNIALRHRFNRFLSQIKSDGVHAGMVSRWLLTHDIEMPDLAVSNPRGTLVVGVSGSGLPFAAVKDGALVGFDIELIQRFAAHLGRSVTFRQMPFASLIAATASGKVEMIAASIFITDERKQRIDFSDPYHEAAVVVYALKSNLAGGAATATPGPGRDSFLGRVLSSFPEQHRPRESGTCCSGMGSRPLPSSLYWRRFSAPLSARWCASCGCRAGVAQRAGPHLHRVLRGTPVVVLLMIIFYVVFASVNINPCSWPS